MKIVQLQCLQFYHFFFSRVCFCSAVLNFILWSTISSICWNLSGFFENGPVNLQRLILFCILYKTRLGGKAVDVMLACLVPVRLIRFLSITAENSRKSLWRGTTFVEFANGKICEKSKLHELGEIWARFLHTN